MNKIGDIKIKRRFAIFPIFFKGKKIWLRKYAEVREYKLITGLLAGTGGNPEGWLIIDKI